VNAKVKPSLLAGIDLESMRSITQEALGKKPTLAPAENPGADLVALRLPLDLVEPDPDQPRRSMEAGESGQSLEELAESILQYGILQPITVQAMDNGRYQIVSGERRWRAARMARDAGRPCARKEYDLTRIPAVVQPKVDGSQRLEMQLVENLAREDMRIEDIGAAIRALLDSEGLSKEELSRRLGRSRGWINVVLARTSEEAKLLARRLDTDLDRVSSAEISRLLTWMENGRDDWLDELTSRLRDGYHITRSLLMDIEAQKIREENAFSTVDLREPTLQEPALQEPALREPAATLGASSIPSESAGGQMGTDGGMGSAAGSQDGSRAVGEPVTGASVSASQVPVGELLSDKPEPAEPEPAKANPGTPEDGWSPQTEPESADVAAHPIVTETESETDTVFEPETVPETEQEATDEEGIHPGYDVEDSGTDTDEEASGATAPQQDKPVRIALPESVWRILLDRAGIAGPVTEENVRMAILS